MTRFLQLSFKQLFRLLLRFTALIRVEDALANAEILRRHFEQFVVRKIFDSLIHRHRDARGSSSRLRLQDNQRRIAE